MEELQKKSIQGFVFLIFLMVLLLFLPAGSFRFWQGWVYIVVSTICTLLITVYLMRHDLRLLASRVEAGPAAERTKSQRIIQAAAGILFMSMLVVPGLDYRFHWSSIPPTVSLIADLFVALSFVIIFLVFRENSFASATIEVVQGQKVIRTGPYAIVRHPMYSGAIVLFLSSPLALGSWFAFICSALLIVVLVARLLDEEKYLAAHLPGYAEYRREVRFRLMPYIW